MKLIEVAAAAAFALLGSRMAFAQLTAATDGPIVYGHHHLYVTSVEAHNDDLKITVRFSTVGQKKLLAKFAKLEPA